MNREGAPPIDHQDEILSDFLAEAEDYYTLIQEGGRLIERGQVSLGVDSVLRPIHTIKGTAGFVAGLEPLAAYTHRLEDMLRAFQQGVVASNPRTATLVVRGLDEVFNIIEQVRQGAEAIDDNEARKILEEIERTMSAASRTSASSVLSVEVREGVRVIRVQAERLHLPVHYSRLLELLANVGDGDSVLLDLSGVRTIGSTAWGAVWQAGEAADLTVVGLSQASRIIFQRWGFDEKIATYDSEAVFWAARSQSGPSPPVI